MAYKPDKHGRDQRDGAEDPISGEWVPVINAGDPAPENWMVLDEDYVELQNGWAQPAAPYAQFSFRRGLSKLDTKGHLDSASAASATVAVTIPADFRLPDDQFFLTVLQDATPALVYLEASTGDVTITFPV